MASQLSELSPAIKFGENDAVLVQVGTLDWRGLKEVRNALRRANLTLPQFSAEGFKQELAAFQSSFGPGGEVPITRVVGLAMEFLSSNAETVFEWILHNPEILEPIILGSSNLSQDDLDKLTPGQTIRIFRASWKAVIADGLFSEIAGFFGEWFQRGAPPPSSGQKTNGQTLSEQPVSSAA